MKQTNKAKAIFYSVLFLAIFVLIYNVNFGYSWSAGLNYRNVTIDTRVNITNAAPEIMSININPSVTLVAGSTKTVYCNVSVRDWNNYTDIDTMNATLFHSSSSESAADDNNTHYSNSNCAIGNQGGNWKNFTCSFDVYYYAEPGTWNCSAYVNDSYNYIDTAWNTTTIQQVLALNVTPVLDYGNLAVTDYSGDKTANVTNIGNVPINVSVKGYGQTENDGLAFVCQVGNITIDNEKWDLNSGTPYVGKTALTGSFVDLTGLTVNKQTIPGNQITNTTYWELYVPPNPFGLCNGNIVFQAEAS